jgi:hypothetical protein
LPKLRKYVKKPARIEELLDNNAPSYSIRCGDIEFEIYAPHLDDGEESSWGRATVALFAIVNHQLKNSDHRFYAIGCANDLCGIFLTSSEATTAKKSLPNKRDWPYLPKDVAPWYGQYH